MSDRGPIRACLTAVAFAVACVLAALVTVILVAIVDHLLGLESELAQDASVVVASLATVACGAWAARRVWLHQVDVDGAEPREAGRRWSRSLVGRLLILGYVLTWAFGAPAIQSHEEQWAVDEYKRIVAKGSNHFVLSANPSFRTLVAFPLFPGVVASFRSYQITGLYGCTGWEFHAWWPGGVYRLWQLPIWVS